MTPDQALAILDQAASLARLPRGEHEAVLRALQVLTEAVKPAATIPAPQAVHTDGASPCA